MSYDFYNPPYEKISVEIKDGDLNIIKGGGWADRNNSMERLLLSIKYKLDLLKNKKFIINTSDKPINTGDISYTVLSNSTIEGYYDIPIPHFVYDHWKEAKIDTWETTIKELIEKSYTPYKYNKAI